MKKDKAYLKHIFDAISDIEKFVEGVSEEEFFGNKEKQYAVLRAWKLLARQPRT